MQALGFDSHEAVHVKALIYGKPGTGKTTMGVSAPKPLILLSERQGMTHVRQAAAMIGRQPVGVLFMDGIEDYRCVLRTLALATQQPALRDGPFVVKDAHGSILFESETWPETVVIDSLTDVCRLIDAQILLESPPKLGKDNLPVNSERYWSVLRDRCEKFIRSFRDIDFHVLYLCLEDDKTIGEGDEAERKVGPALPMRALPDTVAAAVNVVGVMARRIRQRANPDGTRSEEAAIDYLVRTVGPQWYLLKPYRPLLDLEQPDFSSWVARIVASANGEAVPSAPVASLAPTVEPKAAPAVSTPQARTRRPRSQVAPTDTSKGS